MRERERERESGVSKWKSQGWVRGDGGVIKCKEVTSKTLERKEKMG